MKRGTVIRTIGWVLTALASAALLASAAGKLASPPEVTEQFVDGLGFPADVLTALAVIEIIAVVLLLIPRSAVFGAIIITGYLGGATAAHVRVDDAFVAPVVLGTLPWIGLSLRRSALRAAILGAPGPRVSEPQSDAQGD